MSKIFIIETDWMINLFQKQYAKCRVFAFLYGLTTKGQGWKGDYRRLSKVLCISDEGVRKILIELRQAGLIKELNGVITTCYEPANSVGDTTNSVCNFDNIVGESGNSVGSLPPTPPIIKEIIKERENIIAREPIATLNPHPSSFLFEDLVELYKRCTGKSKIDADELREARSAWESRTPGMQAVLIKEVQNPCSDKIKDRLSWTIADYKFPRPRKIDGEPDADRLYKEGKLCIARFKGESAYATYIYSEALLWDMEIKEWLDPNKRL